MRYTPEQYLQQNAAPRPARLPLSLTEQIERYEAELDLLHPGWRLHQDFGGNEFNDTRAAIKWLLKRVDLLRQGRDWPVDIAWAKRRPFAHPNEPNHLTPPPDQRPERVVSPWSEREIDEQIARNRAERGAA